MSQVQAAIMGVLGILYAAIALIVWTIVRSVWMQDAGSAEDELFIRGMTNAAGLGAAMVATGFFVGAAGIARDAAYGRILSFALTGFSALSFIGLPWAVAQFFVLTKE